MEVGHLIPIEAGHPVETGLKLSKSAIEFAEQLPFATMQGEV